jgi:hypothetical protein
MRLIYWLLSPQIYNLFLNRPTFLQIQCQSFFQVTKNSGIFIAYI